MHRRVCRTRRSNGVAPSGSAFRTIRFLAIVERLGAPLLTSSVLDDEETEYMTNPELIHERYGRDVELVIDGGVGGTRVPSRPS